ncbi:MAG: membrane protein insertion efficiency factor YidD [Elusimicrobiota bacterium]|nr:membrane protein insertion efficiency factor YidD [Elusimicrobiota bacterium]
MKHIALLLIKFYQLFISPILLPSCRFHPSCSNYAYQAIQVHGFIKGSFLALKRIARCHPFCKGGIDPVPAKNTKIIK